MEQKCTMCKVREDIRLSDSEIHVCNVCYLEQNILDEYVRPKLRKIVEHIVDFDLLERKL